MKHNIHTDNNNCDKYILHSQKSILKFIISIYKPFGIRTRENYDVFVSQGTIHEANQLKT